LTIAGNDFVTSFDRQRRSNSARRYREVRDEFELEVRVMKICLSFLLRDPTMRGRNTGGRSALRRSICTRSEGAR